MWWLILCQLDWATGGPEVWFNVLLGMCVRALLDEKNVWISELNKTRLSPLYGGGRSHPIWRPEQNTKGRKARVPLSACPWSSDQSSPAFRLHLTHQFFFVLQPTGFQTRSHTIDSPGSPPAKCRFRLHHNCVSPILATNLFLSRYTFYHSVSLETP